MKKSFLLYLLIFGTCSLSFSQTSFDVQVTGSGPAIILIPGLASDGDVWKETAEQLSQNYECHVLTLPGFAGQPSMDLSEGFLPQVKTQITEYIHSLDQEVILIGHSLGGFLSLQLANELPDQVKQAVIVDSYPFYSAAMNPAATVESMKPMAAQMKQMIEALSEEDFEKQQNAGMPMMTNTQDRIPTLVSWSLASDRSTFSQAMYELMLTDYRKNLSTLKTPILVLGAWYSGKDYGLTAESVKGNFAQQYQLAENVQIEMAPTAFHFIMWDNPEWMMEKIHAFIQ
ncbi:pimeloyl-ACP methyl ester carboxylesterase [Algoriphagus iocasae]|uniref:Pimeloyl-ACP methyl ester carboxylesterase n=1 Tax=Algoriphagus iocasae TaxID=1836499 RepID=A0A841MU75_9BACT|nr:alpha/beta hydrolase [Algoriphagus iocasae]MBB6325571.1 pimeloyl-ACP methyl ester carboxylesterase [Algoriphagus iocasae]